MNNVKCTMRRCWGATLCQVVPSKTALRYSLFIIHFTLFISCTSADKLGKLDLRTWRGDRGGCQGKRSNQIEAVRAIREELKGMTENEIADQLGRPDINQLIDRNQKFYIYFLEQGGHCESVAMPSQARSVALRMSAIGVVTEVTFQRGKP